MMNPTCQWLGGFFDGEGGVAICGDTVSTHLTQKDPSILETIKIAFPGAQGPLFNEGPDGSAFRLDWRGLNGKPFLLAIRDHVILKKDQVEAALEILDMVGDPQLKARTVKALLHADEVKQRKTALGLLIRMSNGHGKLRPPQGRVKLLDELTTKRIVEVSCRFEVADYVNVISAVWNSGKTGALGLNFTGGRLGSIEWRERRIEPITSSDANSTNCVDTPPVS
jgi:hypothetical protein